MLLCKELLPITALIMTGHIVSNENIPATEETFNYNYEENKLLRKPTLLILIFRKILPKFEYKNEIISAKADADIVSSKNGLAVPDDYVNIPICNVVGNRKDILRKKKKEKKKSKGKKDHKCKNACKVAVKTVCKNSDCSKKKKKSIAKRCLKKCNKKS